jgi:hypothetical protein
VHYDLDTWANDQRFDSKKGISQRIGNHDVTFTFDDDHDLKGVDVYVPHVIVNRHGSGTIVPLLPQDKEIEIYRLVNYIANVLWKQTGRGSFSRNNGVDYIPETEDDKRLMERQTITRAISIKSSFAVRGKTDLSPIAMSRYLNQSDALAMFADASRMTNPTGKFAEFFRIMEHYFPYKGKEFDTRSSEYLHHLNPVWTKDLLAKLRDLRNRCSHAKNVRGYITSNNLTGLKEIEQYSPILIQMTETLLNSPPP